MSIADPVTLKQFVQRYLRGNPQLNPVLTAFGEVLMNMWDLYDELSTISIIANTFEFITSSCLEPELDKSPPIVEGIRRFPWFIRQKSGLGAGFALQLFTKSDSFMIMEILKAIADMDYWISLSNDLLS